jgi:hypothetical protein
MFERIKDFLFGPTAERRQEPRIAAVDGAVEIDGQFYPVKNWNSAGFLATSCAIERDISECLDIRFRARLGQQVLDVACRATVVRIDTDRQQLAARFAKLDDAVMCEIARCFTASATVQ